MRKFNRLSGFTLLLALFAINAGLIAQVSLPSGSSYRYIKASQADNLPDNWNTSAYDVSSWATASAPFRYGVGAGGTLLDDMRYTYSTVYLRSTFTATNAARIEELNITANFDDGFVLWINGEPVITANAPARLYDSAFATALHSYDIPVTYTIYTSDFHLAEGINTLAVQVLNYNLSSSDLYFDISITGTPALPRVNEKPLFSHPSGFYTSNFSLTLTAPLAGLKIKYTIDGSLPDDSPTAITAASPVTIAVNPASSTGRATTPAFVVRASCVKDGYRASFPVGATFIYTSKVKTQDYPGGNWPSGNVNGQVIDLQVDSKVTTDSRYAASIEPSLKALPSISIITDNSNLFDAATGIYVNAGGHGEDWERECSVELINPDGTPGFNVNAGLRIRGGWSRHDDFPKHAFRLFFKSRYGDSKLDFPLFGTEGAGKFNKIDLRCEQNYSWANNPGDGVHNTLVREVFSRDLQRDLGKPYTRSRYYHLYLNGMYWGIYQTQERSEADFAASYFGGDAEDYDVVKVSTENWNYRIEATDGFLDAWREIWNLCLEGFADSVNYNLVQGKDPSGLKVEGAPVLVDIDNLIDYMLVIFYTGNFDSPTSAFMSNNGCNNFFVIRNRKFERDGFTFFAHDCEHTMMADVVSPGIGLYEDRVNIGTSSGNKMTVGSFDIFHPQWLHFKLSANAEYRMRFADRAYQVLRAGNQLSVESNLSRFNTRVNQISTAIISESARWGDTYKSYAYTKDDNWIPELDEVRNDYFPYRSDILVTQLKQAGLYTTLDPAIIKALGTALFVDTFSFQGTVNVSLSNPKVNGDVYYTLNNEDPRMTGGAINPHAIKAGKSISFDLTTSAGVMARIYFNGVWSVLTQVNFLKTNEDYSNLKVTELMYHPPDVVNGYDTVFGTSLEFIEFKNTGTSFINVSGMRLQGGVSCVFPPNSILGPGEFYVAVSKVNPFHYYYNKTASANFSGNLSNSGELIILADPAGNPVIAFNYSDFNPWPAEPDGQGNSLVAAQLNPTGDPNYANYWKASAGTKGSPFADDDISMPVRPLVQDMAISVFPNPSADKVYISGLNGNTREEVRIELYDLNGRLIFERQRYQGEGISLRSQGISPGIYLLKVHSGSMIQMKKLVYNPGSNQSFE
ncbi:MAG: CotH kinase family protein [Bacteroidales bacterium]